MFDKHKTFRFLISFVNTRILWLFRFDLMPLRLFKKISAVDFWNLILLHKVQEKKTPNKRSIEKTKNCHYSNT